VGCGLWRVFSYCPGTRWKCQGSVKGSDPRFQECSDGQFFCVGKNKKCLVSTENNLFCSGGNDNMICVWTYDGKLHGKIERRDGEHLHCMMIIRNNRLVTASDSTLCMPRPLLFPPLLSSLEIFSSCYHLPVVYNLISMSEHKRLSVPNERAHREAVRCLCQVSGSFSLPAICTSG